MTPPRIVYKDGTPLLPGDLYGVYWSQVPYIQYQMLIRTERVTDLDHPLVEQGMTKFYVMDVRTGKVRSYISSHDVVVDLKPS